MTINGNESGNVRPNKMDRKTARALEDLILSMKGDIEAGKWSMPAFAEAASKKLKAIVTKGNVLGSAKAVGVQFNAANR